MHQCIHFDRSGSELYVMYNTRSLARILLLPSFPSSSLHLQFAIDNLLWVFFSPSFDLYEIIKEASFVRHTAKTVIGMFLALWVFSLFFFLCWMYLCVIEWMYYYCCCQQSNEWTNEQGKKKQTLWIHKALMTWWFFSWCFSIFVPGKYEWNRWNPCRTKQFVATNQFIIKVTTNISAHHETNRVNDI